MTTDIATDIEQQRAQAKEWFESLRDRICAEIETLEREAVRNAAVAPTPEGEEDWEEDEEE